MDVYVLDNQFRRVEVIDQFESLIWTERFSAWGDFTLVTEANSIALNMLKPGARISITDSRRVMNVENVEVKLDQENRQMLTASGRSLEAIMADRLARDTIVGLDTKPKWAFNGLPAAIARFIFKNSFTQGVPSQSDAIGRINADATLYPVNTLPEPAERVRMEFDPITVYDAVKQICDAYSMGFRMYIDIASTSSQIFFDVYTGSDRTTGQSSLTPVIFSPAMNNIEEITTLDSNADFKNTAYVIGKSVSKVVYAPGWDATSAAGWFRKVLIVTTDEKARVEAGDTADFVLESVGQEALAKRRNIQMLDGKISQNNIYRYNTNYHLGDVVEMRNQEGTAQYMRVTEQIIVSDREGDRSYPTLSTEKFIVPGTWPAWDYLAEWETSTKYWDEA